MAVTAHQIEAALRGALGADAQFEVVNESHLHAGHAGAGEGSHWRVKLSGARLTGLSRIARHRLVYDALSDLMPQGIHALAIEAQPSEHG
jgi:BolA protein